MSASSTDSVPYFPSEPTQLTDAVLANLESLNLTGIEYFSFGNASLAALKRNAAVCKLLPGDESWPSDVLWTVLDLLLGGALIESVPIAAPCYSSQPEYNEAECATITSLWSSPEFQYVKTLHSPRVLLWERCTYHTSSITDTAEKGIGTHWSRLASLRGSYLPASKSGPS